jgi:putative glutamine amidotransferase
MTINKPTVGVVPALTPEDHRFEPQPAYRFQFLKEQYYEPLEKRGLLPVVIPASECLGSLSDYCELISGLLLAGGEDINPNCYHEEIGELTRALPPQRDRFEIELVHACRAGGLPLLGICRGLQLLNVACGGSLYQDLSQCPGAADHRQEGELDFSTHHQVNILTGTRLHDIIGRDRIQTNTGHHQAIKDLGVGLTVAARAEDGVIEAVEGEGFTVAVQWHPESWQADEVSIRLFDAFAAAVRDFAAEALARRRDQS